MPLLLRIGDALGVEPPERRSAGLMLAHSFAMGLATTFFETAASALFLARFGAPLLPWMYIGAAVVNTATGLVYTSVQRRLPFAKLMTATLVLLISTVSLLRAGLALSSAPWLVFGLLVWYRAVSALTDLEYWAVATRLYDVRQAKRLFGLIGSGEVVARIVASFSVPLLAPRIGVTNLVTLSALALGACLALVLPVLALEGSTAPRRRQPSADGQRGLGRLLSNRYLLLLCSIAFFGVLAKYLVDFAFLSQVKSRYTDATAVAGFFGLFSGISQVLSLLARVFLSGPLLSRYGIRLGLLALPVAHAACTALIVAQGLGFGNAALLFWLVVANQGIYKTFKHPIDNPSFKVLYQPLRAEERLSAQIAVETMVTPVTTGLAGLVMLLFTVVIPYAPARFALVMLATFAGWVTVARLAGRGYADALTRALRSRFAHDEPLSFDDARSRTILEQTLDSPDPAQVLLALDVLQKCDSEHLADALIRLLRHSSPSVRLSALQRIERLEVAEAAADIVPLTAASEPVAIRVAAVGARAALGGEPMARALEPFLDDPAPEVRQAALVGLLRHCGRTGKGLGEPRLESLVGSPEAVRRVAAAGAIEAVGGSDWTGRLLDLIGDADVGVRRAALSAAGRVEGDTVWATVAAALGDRRVAAEAAAALGSGGEPAVPCLAAAIDRAAAPRARILAARTLGRIKSETARRALEARMGAGDAALRTEVLESLGLHFHRAEGAARLPVVHHIHEEARDAAWKIGARHDLGHGPDLSMLSAALDREIAEGTRRLFLLLSFLYDRKAIFGARDNLTHPSKDKRAYASEILDVTLPAEMKALLMPILDAPSVRERGQAGGGDVPGRLGGILERGDAWLLPWTRAMAARVAESRGVPVPPDAGRSFDMLTIERVILLKAVDVFSRTSEDVLAEIAGVLEEVQAQEGQTIFQKGDMGDSLYIIVDGRVRVHDGDTTIGELGEKDIFGELALLDPEPRFASISALTDVRLFRLDRETFSELMAGNIEIVRGVLHVLCQRLREETREHVPHRSAPRR
jgi:HEAT repeat protein